MVRGFEVPPDAAPVFLVVAWPPPRLFGGLDTVDKRVTLFKPGREVQRRRVHRHRRAGAAGRGIDGGGGVVGRQTRATLSGSGRHATERRHCARTPSKRAGPRDHPDKEFFGVWRFRDGSPIQTLGPGLTEQLVFTWVAPRDARAGPGQDVTMRVWKKKYTQLMVTYGGKEWIDSRDRLRAGHRPGRGTVMRLRILNGRAALPALSVVVAVAAAAVVWHNLPTPTDLYGPFDVHGAAGAPAVGRAVTADRHRRSHRAAGELHSGGRRLGRRRHNTGGRPQHWIAAQRADRRPQHLYPVGPILRQNP